MVFDDIAGQKNAIRSLKNSILKSRVAHAYLFHGPDGVGKSVAASIFASVLNCSKKGSDPCGRCPSCIKTQYGNHPDIIHIKAQKSSISVDDIRDMQTEMKKKPYEKGVKVFIMHNAEKMTEQAQNALLKILEDPPGYVVVILLTHSRYSILSTIISRCQVINFTRASEGEIVNFLKSKYNVSDSMARVAAAFSCGIVKNAVDFINDDDLKKARNEIIELSMNILCKDRLYGLSMVEYFMENKDKIDSILDIMTSWYRDILIYKECQDAKYLMNPDKASDIAHQSSIYTSDRLNNIIDIIKNALLNIKSNVNYQLVIENMLLNIQEGSYGNSYRYKV